MDEQKKQLVEKLKSSMNILVTVHNNPTVDSLSACIGLTLILNKMGKHASAVFSGDIPSTIEFLRPEDTLERNTNSLRDFIIALDKSKADKLRYKVEDKVVRIFITPYKTSISADDLDFSQGDFNVDSVVALGAHEQQDLDQAITEHGRILHDAVVMSINNADEGNLGSINWQDNSASSLSELVVELSKDLDEKHRGLLDGQIATALLTGIVAETDRFSNAKTSAETMNTSAVLMEAGANQQLVATKLEEAMAIPATVRHDDNQGDNSNDSAEDADQKRDDGTLEIDHEAAQNNPNDQTNQNDENNRNNQEDHTGQDGKSEQGNQNQDNHDSPDSGVESDLSLPNDVITPDTNQLPKEEKLPEIKPLHPHDSMLPPVKDVPSAEVSDITGVNFMAEQPSGTPSMATMEPEGVGAADDPLGKPHTPALEHAMLDHNGPAASRDDAPKPPEQPQPTPPEPPQPELDLPAQPQNPTFTPYEPPRQDNPKQPEPFMPQQPVPPATSAVEPPQPVVSPEGQTLSELEKSVHSTHAEQPAGAIGGTDIDAARSEVLKALQQSTATPEPIAALGAQPLGEALHPEPTPVVNDLQIDQNGNLQMPQSVTQPSNQPVTPGPLNPMGSEPAPNPMSPADQPMDMPLPPSLNIPPPQTAPPTNSPGTAGISPPPEPPPMFPPFPQR